MNVSGSRFCACCKARSFNRQDVRVLDVMRRYIDVVEKNENHVFHGQLSDIHLEDILKADGNGQSVQQQSEA